MLDDLAKLCASDLAKIGVRLGQTRHVAWVEEAVNRHRCPFATSDTVGVVLVRTLVPSMRRVSATMYADAFRALGYGLVQSCHHLMWVVAFAAFGIR